MRLAVFLLAITFLLSYSGYAQNASLEKKANLPTPTLDEISGMIFWNGKLYGHEDGGNSPTLFEIDSATGVITKTITLSVLYTPADDWEDITQDEIYIYIGNFGNNANGSRKDLKFYRIPKSSVLAIGGATGTIPANEIDIINFSYPDQTNFCPEDYVCSDSVNNTTFDCEAVIVDNGILHLFTKDWVTFRTVHYTVPAMPGTWEAERKEEFNTDGLLITGATKIANNIIALLGYQKPTQDQIVANNGLYCKIWLIMGFTDINKIFTTATETKNVTLGKFLAIPLSFPFFSSEGVGQQEAITVVDGTRVFIAGERFNRSQSIFTWDIPAQLYAVELADFIPQNIILSEGIRNFVSKTSEDAVILSWDYLDSGANFFEVQVSLTGNDDDFKTIGKINADNSFPYTYTFPDKSVVTSEKIFYRVKVTKLDGRIIFSKILFIKNNEGAGFNLKAFPSPFTDKLTVNFNNMGNHQVQLSIVDAYGRSVLSRRLSASPGNYNIMLDGLSNLTKGIYFLTCRTADNLVIKKIVKQ